MSYSYLLFGRSSPARHRIAKRDSTNVRSTCTDVSIFRLSVIRQQISPPTLERAIEAKPTGIEFSGRHRFELTGWCIGLAIGIISPADQGTVITNSAGVILSSCYSIETSCRNFCGQE